MRASLPTKKLPRMWWKRKADAPQGVLKQRGAAGERLAARYLFFRGYRIIARNLRLGRNEIDLIVRRGDTIAFVEVKTRQRSGAWEPHDAVGETKQRHIKAAAHAWLAHNEKPGFYYRFDVVSIVMPEHGKAQITHLPDAFR